MSGQDLLLKGSFCNSCDVETQVLFRQINTNTVNNCNPILLNMFLLSTLLMQIQITISLFLWFVLSSVERTLLSTLGVGTVGAGACVSPVGVICDQRHSP